MTFLLRHPLSKADGLKAVPVVWLGNWLGGFADMWQCWLVGWLVGWVGGFADRWKCLLVG